MKIGKILLTVGIFMATLGGSFLFGGGVVSAVKEEDSCAGEEELALTCSEDKKSVLLCYPDEKWVFDGSCDDNEICTGKGECVAAEEEDECPEEFEDLRFVEFRSDELFPTWSGITDKELCSLRKAYTPGYDDFLRYEESRAELVKVPDLFDELVREIEEVKEIEKEIDVLDIEEKEAQLAVEGVLTPEYRSELEIELESLKEERADYEQEKQKLLESELRTKKFREKFEDFIEGKDGKWYEDTFEAPIEKYWKAFVEDENRRIALEGIIGENIPEDAKDDEKKEEQFLLNFIPRIIDIVLKFVAPLVVIMFIYTGIRFVYAGSDEESLKQSKEFFLYSVIGVIIIVLSYSVMKALYFIVSVTPVG